MEATFCVSNEHCIERYFEGLTAIFRHILIICYLKARVGQNQRVKSIRRCTNNSKSLYALLCEYSNAWLHAYIINSTLFQNTVCTPFHIVPKQCSICSRTVNGAACRTFHKNTFALQIVAKNCPLDVASSVFPRLTSWERSIGVLLIAYFNGPFAL
jgi:hypothetical protein